MTVDVVGEIVSDVMANRRTFLPGPTPDAEDMRRNMVGAVQFDGLNIEERGLLLSTLPRGVSSLYVRPLDKGLSGAKVLAARYRLNQTWSKRFVIKIGVSSKLAREAHAMEEFVAPYIQGIETPIVRVGVTRSLLAQELRGLTPADDPTSLRLYVRDHDGSDAAVRRLLTIRLAPWYMVRTPVDTVALREAFKWHLGKAPQGIADAFPTAWADLPRWVEDEVGAAPPTEAGLTRLLGRSVAARLGVVHGDLHAQNVLVDVESGECWPIDFGWCDRGYPAVIDLVMLECSLKFLAIPMRADLRSLIQIDSRLAEDPFPRIDAAWVPYRDEIRRCLSAIEVVRRHAVETLNITFEDYRAALTTMTYCLAGHQGLNRPFVLASLQMLMAELETTN